MAEAESRHLEAAFPAKNETSFRSDHRLGITIHQKMLEKERYF